MPTQDEYLRHIQRRLGFAPYVWVLSNYSDYSGFTTVDGIFSSLSRAKKRIAEIEAKLRKVHSPWRYFRSPSGHYWEDVYGNQWSICREEIQ